MPLKRSGKVWFVGAGPGDPDLITVKGRDLVAGAGAILYAGSLVAEAALRSAPAECEIADSKDMTLPEITAWLTAKAHRHERVIRLQTGDPSLYGALIEMVRPLDAAGIEVGVVPGVSSAMAAAAAATESLTLPGVTQTVILTRIEGRTRVPEGERLEDLARHGCSVCLFLSIGALRRVQGAFLAAGWHPDAPVLVVHKASWPGEETVLRGTLADIEETCRAAGIESQAMIVVSPNLGARHWPRLETSKLYDAAFGHRFRPGSGREGTRRGDEMDQTVTEQATGAGRRIEGDSFAIIDREAGTHGYEPAQWAVVRRMIHASADFDFNGLTRFHPLAVTAGVDAILAGRPIVADVEMIRAGLSRPRLDHFGIATHQFIADPDVVAQARAEDSTRAVQALRKAWRLGVLDGAIVAVGNAPTALLEVVRLVREEDARPGLVVGMPVGFVAAAESKAALCDLDQVPWILTEGRKGGSTLVVAALHALLALAEERQRAGA